MAVYIVPLGGAKSVNGSVIRGRVGSEYVLQEADARACDPYSWEPVAYLMADTPEELWKLAGRLIEGVDRTFSVETGTLRERMVLSRDGQANALRSGGIEITRDRAARIIREKQRQIAERTEVRARSGN